MSQEIDVSVIVPAYRAERTLKRCVESLRAIEFEGTYEIIVVVSADERAEIDDVDLGSDIELITLVPRTWAAIARNIAVERSNGRFFAFADADVVVSRSWLTELVAAADDGTYVVGGAVLNGTPSSPSGTVEYLVEFSDLHPRRPVRTAWHGATCNLGLSRELWTKLGPWPEDMGGGEDTLLSAIAGQEGLFRFAPRAQVTHLNRTGWRTVMAHQYELGEFGAIVVRRTPYYKFGVLVRHPTLALIGGSARVISIYARVVAWMPERLAFALLLSPMVLVACLCWGAGVMTKGIELDAARRRGRSDKPAGRRVR